MRNDCILNSFIFAAKNSKNMFKGVLLQSIHGIVEQLQAISQIHFAISHLNPCSDLYISLLFRIQRNLNISPAIINCT
jgi:hypothetical protein